MIDCLSIAIRRACERVLDGFTQERRYACARKYIAGQWRCATPGSASQRLQDDKVQNIDLKNGMMELSAGKGRLAVPTMQAGPTIGWRAKPSDMDRDGLT